MVLFLLQNINVASELILCYERNKKIKSKVLLSTSLVLFLLSIEVYTETQTSQPSNPKNTRPNIVKLSPGGKTVHSPLQFLFTQADVAQSIRAPITTPDHQ